jgi:hypothetical protein
MHSLWWASGERRGLRRRLPALAGGVLLLTLLVVLTCFLSEPGAAVDVAAGPAGPQLLVDGSVAPDLETLARQTWTEFVQVFAAWRGCFGDVHLRAARALDSRAAYDPATATVTVRVPGTAAMLRSGLLHEWGHHIEFQCQGHEALRPAFLAAQGLPPDTAWRPDVPPADLPAGLWADIPSEQYAEAVIEVVLGGRPVPTNVRLTREAVRIVAEWARGEACPACP